MTIGRIGGPMLKENLIRQGVDLSFETNLLYLDVNNMRVGVNTDTPTSALDVNGTARFGSNLQIDNNTISTLSNNLDLIITPHGTGKLTISYLTANRVPYNSPSGTIIDSANLTFDGSTLTVSGLLLTGNANLTVGNLKLSNNSITSIDTNGNIVIDPNGNGNIIVESTSIVANRILYSGTNKEIITSTNLTFDGTNLILNGTANANTLNVSTISSNVTNGNINLSPNGTGNVLLSTSTANRVIFTGSNKELLTDADLQFDGSIFQIGNITLTQNTIGNANGNINIAPTNGYRVIFDTTNSIRLPTGDTSERPLPVAGDFRYNSELELCEFYTGTEWKSLNVNIVYNLSESFDGDGSTTVFTLSQETTSEGIFVSLNGVVQAPGVAYGVSSTILTFTEAPEAGDKIDIRYLSLAQTLSLRSIADVNTSIGVNDTYELANITIDGTLQVQVSSSTTKINNNFATTAPVTKTTNFTLADGENFVINDKSSSCIVILPNPALHIGRQVTFKNLQAQSLSSNSSNVCPIDNSTPGTLILSATAGKWATLVSDGTNWIIMAAN